MPKTTSTPAVRTWQGSSPATAPCWPRSPRESTEFERRFFEHTIPALDRYSVQRGRTKEGKDGNPLNEVRMLCDALMENQGRMCANETTRYRPERSILRFWAGDEIRLNADDFARRSAAFFDRIERK